MYNLNEYAFLVGDPARMRAHADALAALVRPGSVVADLGAGGGVFSVIAAKAGARRVYAIEAMPLGSVVAHAASSSGVGHVVTFVHGISTDVTLPERVDLLVSDLHGVLPLFRRHLPSIVDARTRFLREGGALIPFRETLHAALVSAPGLYQRHVGVFDGMPYGVDMTALRTMAANRWHTGARDDLHLASPIVRIGELDYRTVTDPNLDTSLDLVSNGRRCAHGLAVWFDSELAPGITLSNSPERDETAFGRAFFPFERPVLLAAGDQLRVRLRAALLGPDYTWTWDTDGVTTSGPVRFRQSTFKGIAIG